MAGSSLGFGLVVLLGLQQFERDLGTFVFGSTGLKFHQPGARPGRLFRLLVGSSRKIRTIQALDEFLRHSNFLEHGHRSWKFAWECKASLATAFHAKG